MYSKLFWDNLYQTHLNDVPWMSDMHSQIHLNIINQYVDSVRGKHILDYGCGNGKIAYYYYKLGAELTLVDISDTLVTKLRKEYKDTDIKIRTATTPFDLSNIFNTFDIVMACALLHHIRPDLWNSFLNGFFELTKLSGIVIISGWDNSDILFSKTNIAPYTKEPTWPINKLHDTIISNGLFEITHEFRYQYSLPQYFKENRVFRYYILKVKQKNQ